MSRIHFAKTIINGLRHDIPAGVKPMAKIKWLAGKCSRGA